MRNGKEITVLVIMILVMLVSTAKAEEDPFQFEINNESETVFFGLNDSNILSRIFSRKDSRIGNDSSIKIWIDSTSTLSEISDDYRLVVTLTALF
jgi:hypothetical protein